MLKRVESFKRNNFISRFSMKQSDAIADVDMNTYNLPMNQIAEEWTANLVPQSSLRQEGIYLGAKSSKVIMVDTVKVSLRRRPGQGLGLELMEIAGGREDGYGITLINGIVEGGIAEGSEVCVGDSIAQIDVQKQRRVNDGSDGELSEVQDIESIDIECFGYDKTVEAIGSLPPAESEDESIVFTLKRLRRKPKVMVRLQYPPAQEEPDTIIELFAGENLRRAMLTRGVKLNDKLSERFDNGGRGDCGAEGTCATCVVAVQEGDNLLNEAKIQEKQILAKNPRWRLACKAIVGYGMKEGEMTIRVNPRQW